MGKEKITEPTNWIEEYTLLRPKYWLWTLINGGSGLVITVVVAVLAERISLTWTGKLTALFLFSFFLHGGLIVYSLKLRKRYKAQH